MQYSGVWLSMQPEKFGGYQISMYGFSPIAAWGAYLPNRLNKRFTQKIQYE